jgi:hypothetical protein
MQIPSQPVNTADAAQLRRDVSPAQPAAAVAGVAEQAQKLDPRLALRWAQPVLKGEAAQLMRDSAAAALAPAGAAAYPQLSALASLLGPWMARAEAQLAQGTPPLWPEPGPDDGPTAQNGHHARTAVEQALSRLMSALARSDAFAASRLAQSWWSSAPAPQAEQGVDPGPGAEAQQARWMAALNPGSEGAQQAARLLLGGQLLWEGLLLPDLPARILRQDAWRGGQTPAQPLEKGAALDVQVELPGLGALRVLGQQWGQEVQVQLQLPAAGQARLRARWNELNSRLQALGLGGLQVQEISAAEPAPAAQSEGTADGR